MKILCVDHDSGMLNALQAGLASSGHNVVVAQNAWQALQIIKVSKSENCPVDFMVAALRMPDMNGLDLLRSARQVTARLPVILMTTYANDDIRRKVKELDACEYVEKPFGLESLQEVIKKIGRSETRRDCGIQDSDRNEKVPEVSLFFAQNTKNLKTV